MKIPSISISCELNYVLGIIRGCRIFSPRRSRGLQKYLQRSKIQHSRFPNKYESRPTGNNLTNCDPKIFLVRGAAEYHKNIYNNLLRDHNIAFEISK